MRTHWRTGFSPFPRTTLQTSWLQRGGVRPPVTARQAAHVDRSSMSHTRDKYRVKTTTGNKISELGSGTGRQYLSTAACGEPDDARHAVNEGGRPCCDPIHSLAPPLAPSFEHEHVPY